MNGLRWNGMVAITLWLFAVAGCSVGPQIGDAHGPLEPADFAANSVAQEQMAAPRSAAAGPSGLSVVAAAKADEVPAASVEPVGQPVAEYLSVAPTSVAEERRGSGQQFTVDAMVGQVNGQPIYAGDVLEPIQEQLAALGRSLPPGEFRQRAQQLIEGRLGQMVVDSLILGEAEGDLSVQEQAGLQNILKQQREELIRYWGKGSLAMAEDNLVRQTSQSLEETLSEARQRLLVQRYLRQKLWPKVNVTRRDIERYYNDHIDQYNPPSARTLRLIYVKESLVADQVDQLLDQGMPFQQVASSPLNQYRPDQSGLMSKKAVGGDQVFGQAELNEAMLQLQPGQHSGRIHTEDRYWWIYVESIEQSSGRSLSEVQLEIEQLLTRNRFQQLTQGYRRQLFESGSYNRLDVMGEALMGIAMSRFAAIQ